MDLGEHRDVWLELSHDLVVILDACGRVVQGNRHFEALIGHTLDKIIGQDWFAFCVHPDSIPQEKVFFEQLLISSELISIHSTLQNTDGCRVDVKWHMKAVASSSGLPDHVLCVGTRVLPGMEEARDIVHEHARLMALNKELTCLHAMNRIVSNVDGPLEEILEEILNTIPQAFQYPQYTGVRLTLDGAVFVNGQYDPKASCQLVQDVLVHKIQRGRLRVSLNDNAEKGSAHQFLSTEHVLLGTLVKYIGWIIAKHEALTTQRNLERQLRHADRLAKIGQFAAGIAHELNEPLANILGFAQLAAETPSLSEAVHRDLENIVKSALYSREVIKKLMIFGRQVPLQKTLVDLNRIIQDTVHFIELNAIRGNISVSMELSPVLPDIWADPQHLKQVVVNLVVNAIQSMAAKGILTIQTQSFHNDVYLTVSDTGEGMEPEVLKQIFNPFFTTKTQDQGTGLGLAVVHGIVTSHGGIINVESTPGQGTCFEITFPCAESAPGVQIGENV